ncbi:acyltransferase domain-containing protein [Tahibacter amnicola]|uniref:Acyltransferase domain-containing protein n=1 Tax=Tahibacter amnicola TaxID=2976241 RepID=A0ABY6B9X6_9GAMM|nr:acyltransferase domain-containing protein [Tahibacter amnicola]UXI65938.1 acyltransferase domain-containing protein [Tahibacter amnicola]
MHKQKTIFMFSGQGSQYYQMGQPLYAHNAVFRYWMDHLDAFCRRSWGASILELIYDPTRTRANVFERTPLSGPAIFMVEYALAKALEDAGVRADLTLGASLGTFAAAAVAGAVTPEDALTSIMRYSRVLEQHCPRGGMLAVVADCALFEAPELCSRTELAAINFASHFVVAGLEAELADVERWLGQRGIAHQRVPVSYAFHSRWIDAAREPLLRCFDELPLQPLRIPLICCAQSRTFHTWPDRAFFWNVIRDPIAFSRTIAGLVHEAPYRYLDVGPSGTLATFLRYLLPADSGALVQRVLSPFGGELQNFEAVVGAVRLGVPERV